MRQPFWKFPKHIPLFLQIIEAITGLLYCGCKSESFTTSPLHSKLFVWEKISPSGPIERHVDFGVRNIKNSNIKGLVDLRPDFSLM